MGRLFGLADAEGLVGYGASFVTNSRRTALREGVSHRDTDGRADAFFAKGTDRTVVSS